VAFGRGETGMDREELLDEKTLIARIRDRLRTDGSQAELTAAQPRQQVSVDGGPEALDAELDALAAAADIGDLRLKSYRKLLGPLLTLSRRIARKVLAGAMERQVSYNLANHRLARALRQDLESLRHDYEALRRRCDALQKTLEELRRETDDG
jgi:hypothetical protein